MSIIAVLIFLGHFVFAEGPKIKCIVDDKAEGNKYIFVQNDSGPAVFLLKNVKKDEKCLVEYEFSNLYQGGRGPLQYFEVEFNYKKAKSCDGSQKSKVLRKINLSAKKDVSDNVYALSILATPSKKFKECKEFVLNQEDVVEMQKKQISKKEISPETKNFLIQKMKRK